jgi:hypothetical protein
MRPQPRMQNKIERTSIVTTVTPVSPGIPRAMVLTVSFVLSPVTGLSCHRRLRKRTSANLTPASGRQDHTTSPSACDITRQLMSPRPPHPAPNVRDDRANAPLERHGIARNLPLIWGHYQYRRLRQIGTTGKSASKTFEIQKFGGSAVLSVMAGPMKWSVFGLDVPDVVRKPSRKRAAAVNSMPVANGPSET